MIWFDLIYWLIDDFVKFWPLTFTEEDMETVDDSRHIFVEDTRRGVATTPTPTRGRPNFTRRAINISEQEMVYARGGGQEEEEGEEEVGMVIETTKPVLVDKHVVVKRYVGKGLGLKKKVWLA